MDVNTFIYILFIYQRKEISMVHVCDWLLVVLLNSSLPRGTSCFNFFFLCM
ncbi:hypothetical protein HanIR_Chr17g0869621 [Helianthus annuus]|nr:hypothetical protein HanIR_Chr17g0869621 [Helianthus annuus]